MKAPQELAAFLSYWIQLYENHPPVPKMSSYLKGYDDGFEAIMLETKQAMKEKTVEEILTDLGQRIDEADASPFAEGATYDTGFREGSRDAQVDAEWFVKTGERLTLEELCARMRTKEAIASLAAKGKICNTGRRCLGYGGRTEIVWVLPEFLEPN